jgi:hypothetical protein
MSDPDFIPSDILSLDDSHREEIARRVLDVFVGLGDYPIKGVLSLEQVEEAYGSVFASCGHEPKVIRVHPQMYADIAMRFQSQQRFQSYSPGLGFSDMRFNGAIVIRDNNVPRDILRFGDC